MLVGLWPRGREHGISLMTLGASMWLFLARARPPMTFCSLLGLGGAFLIEAHAEQEENAVQRADVHE